ncbi:MAG: site-specific tyrosine recombinase [Anaerovoracaceae bacterium]|jgi:integrase/recombinase XerD
MYLDEFLMYIDKERNMSRNTQIAYKRDVLGFLKFLEKRGTTDVSKADKADIVAFLMEKKEKGMTASTINRKMASIRAYFTFLTRKNIISENPSLDIKAPRAERRELEYLSVEEVERVLDTPDDSLLGTRDRALMELLYATGIRVNEVIAANVGDVNLRIGFFTCPGSAGKARIIPMGRPAREAVEEYIYEARRELVDENSDEEALFVNYYGNRLTRQGLWKILKEYGEKAGLDKKLTPHLLRTSFAVHMVQNGADLKSLQELLGNEDLTATQVYLSVTKNRIKDVYDKTHPRA